MVIHASSVQTFKLGSKASKPPHRALVCVLRLKKIQRDLLYGAFSIFKSGCILCAKKYLLHS